MTSCSLEWAVLRLVGVSSTSGAECLGGVGDGTAVIAPALDGAGHVDVVGAVDVGPDESELSGVGEANDGLVTWASLVHDEVDVSLHGAVGHM